MIWVTDIKNGQKVAVNPKYIVAVFVASEGDITGKTFISLINGGVAVEESDLDVVGMISGGV